MDFNNPELVAVCGSWVRVQVAFYDFLFQSAMKMCPTHWKEMAMDDVSKGFCDGEDFYETSVKAIEAGFSSPEEAWISFCTTTLDFHMAVEERTVDDDN